MLDKHFMTRHIIFMLNKITCFSQDRYMTDSSKGISYETGISNRYCTVPFVTNKVKAWLTKATVEF